MTWAADPRWHTMNHGAGLDGEDVGLNRFEPTNFYLLGGNLNTPPKTVGVHAVGDILATKPGSGPPGLLRLNNASYFPTIIRFGSGKKDDLKAEVFAHDGRPLRDTSKNAEPAGVGVDVRPGVRRGRALRRAAAPAGRCASRATPSRSPSSGATGSRSGRSRSGPRRCG